MHRVSPTRMTPVRYVGRSGKHAQANPSITNGPKNQLSIIEIPICTQIRDEENISGNFSYCTFARIGHIITMRPMAIAKAVRYKWVDQGDKKSLALTDGYAVEADSVERMLYVWAEFANNNPHNHYHNNERR